VVTLERRNRAHRADAALGHRVELARRHAGLGRAHEVAQHTSGHLSASTHRFDLARGFDRDHPAAFCSTGAPIFATISFVTSSTGASASTWTSLPLCR